MHAKDFATMSSAKDRSSCRRCRRSSSPLLRPQLVGSPSQCPADRGLGTVDMRTVDLMFETSGRIASLAKEEGERVKEGEPAGELDLRALKIERERTAAQLEGLDADWKLALEGYRTGRLMRLVRRPKRPKAAPNWRRPRWHARKALPRPCSV